MNGLNRWDIARKNALIRALTRAKEQTEAYALYLTVDPSHVDELNQAGDVLDHIDNALERLKEERSNGFYSDRDSPNKTSNHGVVHP